MIILDVISMLSFFAAILYFIKSGEKKDLTYLASGMSRSYLALVLVLYSHFNKYTNLTTTDLEVALIVVVVADILTTGFYLMAKKYILEIEYNKTITNLRNLAEKMSLLMETSLTGYFVALPNGIIEKANPSLARLLDVQRSELIGRSLFDFLTSDCKDDVLLYPTFNCPHVRITTNNGKVFDAYISGGKTINGHETITGSVVRLS